MNEAKGNNEQEDDSDEQSDEESSITSERNRQENGACESDNLLESEDSDEDVKEKGSTTTCLQLFEEVEEDGEQVTQKADAKKFKRGRGAMNR